MPPKKKGSSKKPAKARTPVLIDGRTKEEMSKEQMEEHIVHLREELDREREERNYFQLERDKIHTFWEITERELEDFKAELKKAEKDIAEDEERHQVEIKVYKQKMKHLLCEHHNMISESKADGLVSTQVVQKEQEQLETELHKDMRAILVNMEKLDIEGLIKEHELKHKEEMTKRRNSLERQLAETEAKYQKKMELVQRELDIRKKNEINEFELSWNSYNNNLIENHNKALSDLREQSVNRMQQHLDKNDSNRKQIEEIKTITEEKENKRACALQDNEILEAHFNKVQKESDDIEKRLRFYRPEKHDKESAKQKKVDVLKQDCEKLEQKFRKVQHERDELYETFTENIQKVQHKAGLKSAQLDGKVKGLTDRLEKTQAQLSSVLFASNVDQTAFDGVTHKIEEKLDSSNNTIKNLQYKKALISQALKDLLLFYEAKQRALGVPVEEPRAKKAL